MVTFKPIIITSGRRKDGTYPLYIRITQHGKCRRVQTSVSCTAADLSRSLKIKSADVIAKGNALAQQMRDTLAAVPPFVLDTWDVDRVVAHIRSAITADTFRLDFFEFGEKFAKTSKGPTTAKSYLGALNALERFLGRRSLDVNDITHSLLMDFVAYIDAEPKIYHRKRFQQLSECGTDKIPGAASYRFVAKLRHIYEAAKLRYNDEDAGRIVIPRSPFSRISLPRPQSKGQAALPDEVLRDLFLDDAESEGEMAALNAFRLSFVLMGANLADLYRAQPFEGGVWEYHRKKTETRRTDRALMKVEIPAEAAPYIDALRTYGDGRRWWLPVLHARNSSTDSCTASMAKWLGKWCDRHGLPRFTFYAARHSWATIARRLGVEKATVDECLCHKGDFAAADIYAERAWHLMTEANRRVLDYLADLTSK